MELAVSRNGSEAVAALVAAAIALGGARNARGELEEAEEKSKPLHAREHSRRALAFAIERGAALRKVTA